MQTLRRLLALYVMFVCSYVCARDASEISRNTLNNSGFTEVWINPERIDQTAICKELQQRFTDQYIQRWTSELQSSTGKLRTYKIIKKDFKLERYLYLPSYLRIPITRLRVSAHGLRIETGRYTLPKTPGEERVCWNCKDYIEDELHFLFNCPLYENIPVRAELLAFVPPSIEPSII